MTAAGGDCCLRQTCPFSDLCLLDLSAAFDIDDHKLLLLRVEHRVYAVVLQWFQSHLSDRSFRIVFVSSTSFLVHLVCSVPQSSVLALRMFNMHVAIISPIWLSNAW